MPQAITHLFVAVSAGLAAPDGLMDSAWLIVPAAVPLASSLGMFAIGKRPASPLSGWLGIGTAVVVLAAVCMITWNVSRQGLQTHPLGNWPTPLGISLRADGLTCIMLLMSAVVAVFVSVYAVRYFAESESDRPAENQPSHWFWPLWLLLCSALNGLFLSGDVFNLYVTLELLTLSAIGLIVLAGTRTAVEAALRYLLIALAGSLLYLAGVALLYGGPHGTVRRIADQPLAVGSAGGRSSLRPGAASTRRRGRSGAAVV